MKKLVYDQNFNNKIFYLSKKCIKICILFITDNIMQLMNIIIIKGDI